MSFPAFAGAPGIGARPLFTPAVLNLAAVFWILMTQNVTFWTRLWTPFAGQPVKAVVFASMFAALLYLVVTLLAVRWVQKPMLVALLLIGAVSSFYQDKMGITIDREMIQNAMVTTVTESKHLITLPFLLHVALKGVLPAAIVLWVRVNRRSPWRALAAWAGIVVVSLVVFVGLFVTDTRQHMFTLREHKEILSSVQPLAPLSGTIRFVKLAFRSAQVVAAPLGRDAVPGSFLAAEKKPVLLVFWAGETARAQNWGMNGHVRDTTPELRKRGVVNYSDVTSCGTATATSLPCMFSHLTQAEYSHTAGLSHENLLDVLMHAGFKVEWWDNNTGHKNIADRATITGEMIKSHPKAEHCSHGECTDAVFLDFLKEKAATITEDTVLVLHQIGSHGPSYFLRYPEGMQGFSPACQTPVVTDCSPQELAGAYDNTLLYTDWVMAQSIDILQAAEGVVPAMIYASDHGESLGENGLYLHGAPWFMAPEEQIKVPMVIWLSDRFQTSMGLPQDCLAGRASEPASHDNLFSTVLGMVDVETTVRVPALDLTHGCRGVAG